MASSSPPTYTITLRGESFTLSHAQISFDSPNFFTAAFLGDFAEASSRTLSYDRRAELFSVIFEYLAGDDIFPIELDGLSEKKAARAIRAEAEYFQLEGLRKAADVWLEDNSPAVPSVPLDPRFFFKRPVNFAILRQSGSVNGQNAVELLPKSSSPYQLFKFRNLQVKIRNRGTSFSFRITFLTTLDRRWLSKTARDLSEFKTPFFFAPGEELLSVMTLKLGGKVHAFLDLRCWVLSSEPVAIGKALYPEMKSTFGGSVDRKPHCQQLEREVQLSSAIGYWYSRTLCLCHIELEPNVLNWTGADSDS